MSVLAVKPRQTVDIDRLYCDAGKLDQLNVQILTRKEDYFFAIGPSAEENAIVFVCRKDTCDCQSLFARFILIRVTFIDSSPKSSQFIFGST